MPIIIICAVLLCTLLAFAEQALQPQMVRVHYHRVVDSS